MDHNEFNSILSQLKYHKAVVNYATNTIRVLFYDKDDNKLFFFHIDPPWRICINTSMIQNSYNYPYHENYTCEEEEKEKADFNNWCDQTKFKETDKIEKISVNAIGDLCIIWSNQYQLNSFVNDTEEPSYFFYDKVENYVYEVYPNNIVKEKME